ncbi:putative bacteriophage protein [Tetrasphaera phage TJE1]|uniref:Putative bacteriophage protein n=1 Tax=Tetrasphaera phage TJE1 TaxID=981335 RepID=G4W973_9CAUD|nr:putative bacteriophage protein [Tetrasphaera phage TJE1]ADX42561.1 putative bacteriophage protein [Tetrasphaera phage TJE1]
MSFDIGGLTWTPETASQHGAEILSAMNALLQAQGLAPIVATPANALWLFMLAVGSKEQTQDENLAQAINSFNLALASDQQIVNLLPIAGTSLIPGAYSTVTMRVTAGDGTVIVPSGIQLPYGTVNFLTTSGITVPTSGIGFVTAICDTLGAVVVPANGLAAFGSNVPNLASVTNPAAAVTGRNVETANQARQRLINGQTIGWNLNGVQQAISAIPGISAARIYFNESTSENLVLTGAVVIPPRHARIIIAGQDSSGYLIASNYLERITPPTDGFMSQSYTFLSGQVFHVYFDEASTQNVFVRVIYDENVPQQSGFGTVITETLTSISFEIGQTISANTILDALAGFQYASLIDAEVSLDGVTWTNKVETNADAVPAITSVTTVAG